MENEKIEKALDRAAEIEDMPLAFFEVRKALGPLALGDSAFIAQWEDDNELNAYEFWHRAPMTNRREMLASFVDECIAAGIEKVSYKTHAGQFGGFKETAEHTPGPKAADIIAVMHPGAISEEAESASMDLDWSDVPDNAREAEEVKVVILMRAAPELLAALEGLLKVVEAEPEACGIYKAHTEAARAAIDKANGK